MPNAAPTPSASAGWPSSSHAGRRRRAPSFRRDPRLRRTADARRARGLSRRPLRRGRRARLGRAPPGAADADARRRRGRASTARRSPSTSPGTDEQRPGNVNAVEAVTVSAVAFAIRAVTRPVAARERRHDAPGPRGRAGGHGRGRGAAGRGGRGQRGGEPAGRRRVPRRPRAGAPRACRRRRSGDDEQRAARVRAIPPPGCTTRPSVGARAGGRGPTA